ncbi:MAG: hypothetical protein A4E52_01433 [Pelotomaculum sp. PtaB.Bin013]|uniref:Type 4 fimbrial biogenesis protein PilX N-terminal domain-containing protein n=1 Tax=Pelotomaculum isophthalicicum JI TaxID=947010 RepID=A0A9X4H876_9FIRM|nr:hypothetical protein [Pelotomaculum isophthalicicum]MDF9408614.1 hypothetical protein [Pelotomaculum isophthalicicum JI]OPX87096.1 MAG: hypothetical protein A4E52_01433 [Pelotomaculum sp. PtaB.Bin013]
MKSIGSESGQTLVLVVMITLLILLLSFSTLTLVSECRKASFVEKTMVQAYYIADAGVERALAKVKSDNDWLWNEVHFDSDREVEFILNQNYAGGVITRVTVKEESIYPAVPLSREDVAYTNILIISEGTCENSRKSLEVRARVNAPLHFARGVWVNSPDSEFGNGNAGAVTVPPFPALDLSMYEKNYDVKYIGNKTISGDFQVNGIVYVAGDVTISGNYRGVGAIVAGGNVYVSGDLKRYHDDQASSLAILCFGSGGITIADGKEVWALLYTPPGGPSDVRVVNIGSAAIVHGSIICDKIIINPAANALVQYEKSLSDNQPDWTTTNISVTSWQEPSPLLLNKRSIF